MKTSEVRRLLKDFLVKDGVIPPEGRERLSDLARELLDMLRPLTEQELSELKVVNRKESIGSLLIKFGELSKFGKSEWVDLINDYELDLPLNPRDSARDVMGRLARHLREHPDALKAVASSDKRAAARKGRSSKRKRPLAENLQETLARLLDE